MKVFKYERRGKVRGVKSLAKGQRKDGLESLLGEHSRCRHTACPRERGWMSRNAKMVALS